MLLVVEQFLNGLQFGLLLFLLAAGLTLVFGIMDFVNRALVSLSWMALTSRPPSWRGREISSSGSCWRLEPHCCSASCWNSSHCGTSTAAIISTMCWRHSG